MDPATPTCTKSENIKKEMSASLRERLKRCSRYTQQSHARPLKMACIEQPITNELNCSTLSHHDQQSLNNTPLRSMSFTASQLACESFESGIQLHIKAVDSNSTIHETKPVTNLLEMQTKACDTYNPNILSELKMLDRMCPDYSHNSLDNNSNTSQITNQIDSLPLSNYVHCNKTQHVKLLTTENVVSGGCMGGSTCVDDSVQVSRGREQDCQMVAAVCDNSAVVSPTVSLIPLLEVLRKEKQEAEERVRCKEETLRKLNMVKMYRTKNDLNTVDSLTSKWKSVCQQALEDILQSMPEPRIGMAQLINHLQIDHRMMDFDADEETFLYNQ